MKIEEALIDKIYHLIEILDKNSGEETGPDYFRALGMLMEIKKEIDNEHT